MKEPLYADFNAADEDGAIRMFPPFKTIKMKDAGFEPVEGLSLWISDGEIEMRGLLILRDGIWVVVPNQDGFKYLDKNSPFHNDNQK